MKKKKSDYLESVTEVTLKFEDAEEYNRFLNMLGVGMLEFVNINGDKNYGDIEKYFDTYTSVIKQLPAREGK